MVKTYLAGTYQGRKYRKQVKADTKELDKREVSLQKAIKKAKAPIQHSGELRGFGGFNDELGDDIRREVGKIPRRQDPKYFLEIRRRMEAEHEQAVEVPEQHGDFEGAEAQGWDVDAIVDDAGDDMEERGSAVGEGRGIVGRGALDDEDDAIAFADSDDEFEDELTRDLNAMDIGVDEDAQWRREQDRPYGHLVGAPASAFDPSMNVMGSMTTALDDIMTFNPPEVDFRGKVPDNYMETAITREMRLATEMEQMGIDEPTKEGSMYIGGGRQGFENRIKPYLEEHAHKYALKERTKKQIKEGLPADFKLDKQGNRVLDAKWKKNIGKNLWDLRKGYEARGIGGGSARAFGIEVGTQGRAKPKWKKEVGKGTLVSQDHQPNTIMEGRGKTKKAVDMGLRGGADIFAQGPVPTSLATGMEARPKILIEQTNYEVGDEGTDLISRYSNAEFLGTESVDVMNWKTGEMETKIKKKWGERQRKPVQVPYGKRPIIRQGDTDIVDAPRPYGVSHIGMERDRPADFEKPWEGHSLQMHKHSIEATKQREVGKQAERNIKAVHDPTSKRYKGKDFVMMKDRGLMGEFRYGQHAYDLEGRPKGATLKNIGGHSYDTSSTISGGGGLAEYPRAMDGIPKTITERRRVGEMSREGGLAEFGGRPIYGRNAAGDIDPVGEYEDFEVPNPAYVEPMFAEGQAQGEIRIAPEGYIPLGYAGGEHLTGVALDKEFMEDEILRDRINRKIARRKKGNKSLANKPEFFKKAISKKRR